jgi:hypothetical protein
LSPGLPLTGVVTSTRGKVVGFSQMKGVDRDVTLASSFSQKDKGVREILMFRFDSAPEGTMRQIKKPTPFSSYMALMCDLIEKKPFRRKNGQMP